MGIGRKGHCKITTIERSSNFQDVIRPEALNIIDYLELSGDDYLKVGELIAQDLGEVDYWCLFHCHSETLRKRPTAGRNRSDRKGPSCPVL